MDEGDWNKSMNVPGGKCTYLRVFLPALSPTTNVMPAPRGNGRPEVKNPAWYWNEAATRRGNSPNRRVLRRDYYP